MPCAAREQCLIQDRTPQAPDGHLCRGVCGGSLHGLCGQGEDPDSDEPIYRVCPTCAIAKAAAIGSSSGGKSTSTGKRKAYNTRGHGNIGTSKKHASGSKSKSCIRLNFGQKIKILGLLREKVTYGEIARHSHVRRCWMKAETLPTVHQADPAQASGKGALRGSTDAGVAELVNALNALSVGVREAAQGSGVQDKELAEVLVNLQIGPGQPAHKAVIDAVQT